MSIKAMVIDTETDGLVTDHSFNNLLVCYQYYPEKLPVVLENLPHLLQLSVLYVSSRVKLMDEYVSWPSILAFPSESTQWNGIRPKDLTRKGKPIMEVLREFFVLLMPALHRKVPIVGHNIVFDLRIILIEILRIGDKKAFATLYQVLDSAKNLVCTMQLSQPLLNKPQKLGDLYLHLFGHFPANLHDSLIDVLVCYRCFVFMTQNGMDIARRGVFRESFHLLD